MQNADQEPCQRLLPGMPSDPPHLRPTTCAVLLGVLPQDKGRWPQERSDGRLSYAALATKSLGDVELAPVCPAASSCTSPSPSLTLTFRLAPSEASYTASLVHGLPSAGSHRSWTLADDDPIYDRHVTAGWASSVTERLSLERLQLATNGSSQHART